MDRSDIYRSVERAIDQITGNHLQTIIASLRDIRRQDVGDNVAEQEEQAGNKTDEEFEAHVKAMREEREQIYREELRKKKRLWSWRRRSGGSEKRRQLVRERQRRSVVLRLSGAARKLKSVRSRESGSKGQDWRNGRDVAVINRRATVMMHEEIRSLQRRGRNGTLRHQLMMKRRWRRLLCNGSSVRARG